MRKFLPILIMMLLTLSVFAGPSGYSDEAGSPFLKEFSVYPNPSNGAVTITLENLGDMTTDYSLKVYSLIGQEMHAETITPFNGVKKFSLDLTRLPKGIYMVEISDGDKSRIKRVSVI